MTKSPHPDPLPPGGEGLLAALLVLVVLSACRDGGPPAAPADPETELQEICRAFKDGYDVFYGEKRARDLAAELAKNDDRPPAELASLNGRLGWELLKLGRPDEAIAALEKEIELLGEDGDPAGHARRLGRLALAHLQAAEDDNCVLHHSAQSCILPFRDAALHQLPDHIRRTGDLCLEILEGSEAPNYPVMWILNLARMLSGEFPDGVPERYRLPADALARGEAFPPWTDRAAELGVNAVDLAGGAVMDDFDGDGLLDLVSSTWDPCGSLKAFRNDGRGGFTDVTRAWGLAGQYGGLNLVHADYDGDGHLDLLVLRGGWLYKTGLSLRNSLLRNQLHEPAGRFVDTTREAGLARPAYPTQSAAWADYDGDGDLDLFVANEGDFELRPYPSQLFRNDGDGTFTDVAEAAGVLNQRFAKGAAWGDYDDDGDPDLYVSNIGPNRLYRNEGDGTFVDVAAELGMTRPEGRSFATWFFDYDNDGRLDLFVADYGSSTAAVMASFFGVEQDTGHPLLYRNAGGGRFVEVSAELGLTRPQLPMGANYGDLDNDGWPDVYLGTGQPEYEVVVPNVMLDNVRGERFADVTFAGRFGHLQKGHGVAFGDLDNDGDQDLFHQLGGFFPGDAFANALFENPGTSASWITLLLEGRRANRFAVGARLEVRVRRGGEIASVHALAGSGGSFGGSSLRQEIGLGDVEAIEEIIVRWPGSGLVQSFPGVAMNRAYAAVEGEPALRPVDLPKLDLGGG